jgi:hypothetical protein
MKTTLLSMLAVGTCASVALAEPLPPPVSEEGVAAGTPTAGPIALTDAELDQVAAGAFYLRPHYQIENALASRYQTGGGTNGSQLLK